jgi:sugar-specific transcriptional regulator TrmB
MESSDEYVSTLSELGLSSLQAKVYLALAKSSSLKAQEISSVCEVARPDVYRVLFQLEKAGLVEKQIGATSTFRAIPIQLALQILLLQKTAKYRDIEKKTKAILKKHQDNGQDTLQQQEYKFIVVTGKNRIIQFMRKEHDNAQRSVEILSTVQRWLQILEECLESYEKALERGVKYRIIVEKPLDRKSFESKVQSLQSRPDFELRLVRRPLDTNSASFDDREATFNVYPSKSLAESAILWTNQPSFLAMHRDHFEAVWKSARKFKRVDHRRTQLV